MNFRILVLRSAVLPLGALLGMASLGGQAAEWQGLTGNSPFGAGATANAPTPADQLEFRGVVQEEGVYLVNLYNPTTKTSQWLPVNGKAQGLEVKSYDPGADKVEITQGGKPLTLALKQSRVTLVQAPAPAPAASEGGEGARADRSAEGRDGAGREGREGRVRTGSNGEGPPMIRNLPPEAQAMIEEFRRRRAERASQNQQGQGQGQQTENRQNRSR